MIFYTHIHHNKVLVDDELAYKLDGCKLVENNSNNITVIKGHKVTGLGKLLFGGFCTRKDNSIYDFRKRNIEKRGEKKFVGVLKTRDKSKETGNRVYRAVVCYNKTSLSIPGKYSTSTTAAIVREAYIIGHQLKGVTRNKIRVRGRELLDYELVERGQKFYKEYKAEVKRNHIGENGYGIYYRKKCNRYIGKIGQRPICYEKNIIACKCIRNLYIIDNKIKDEILNDVGMTVEEQRAYLEDYMKMKKIQGVAKYRGVIKFKEGYIVKYKTKDKQVYIGTTYNKEEGAMMYNIYVYKNKLRDRVINEVQGYTIEEQIEYLKERGYKDYGDYKFRKRARELKSDRHKVVEKAS